MSGIGSILAFNIPREGRLERTLDRVEKADHTDELRESEYRNLKPPSKSSYPKKSSESELLVENAPPLTSLAMILHEPRPKKFAFSI
jgi:hypothetical protein